MTPRSSAPRLLDILDAIERIRETLADTPLTAFENDWQKRWLVERGVEIISEASRHLADDIKARHPDIPWRKVADIGNVLRHAYENVAPALLWKLANADIPMLERVCRDELDRSSLP